jgi:CheY-like chemotaxis protein
LEADVTQVSIADHAVRPRLLIADDDPSIVRLLADRCTSMGFEVETAINGLQALIKARRSKPDMMIIDVNMPSADGLAVCSRLLGAKGSSVEVMVMTGSADPDTIKRCQSLGAFYGRKGPEFWSSINSALTHVFPGMADKIKEAEGRPTDGEVRRYPRVLVIDDDADTATFLSSRLAKSGVEVLHAFNATQGYRMACKDEPSVIICDYLMPDGDPATCAGLQGRVEPFIHLSRPPRIHSPYLSHSVTEYRRRLAARPRRVSN